MRLIRRMVTWFLVLLATSAFGLAAWAALAPIPSGSRDEIFEIPKGTWARRMSGDKVDILPGEIHLTLGVRDVLVLKNQDDVPQIFGPALMMPRPELSSAVRLGFQLPVCVLGTRERANDRQRRSDAGVAMGSTSLARGCTAALIELTIK